VINGAQVMTSSISSSTPPVYYIEARNKDNQVVESVPLGDAPVRIGSADDNELRLPGREVSRHHLRIDRVGRSVTVTDLDTSHGTKWRGDHEITLIPHKPQTLEIGEVVLFGEYSLLLTTKIGPNKKQIDTSATSDTVLPIYPDLDSTVLSPFSISLERSKKIWNIDTKQPATVTLALHNQGSEDTFELSIEGFPEKWVRWEQKDRPKLVRSLDTIEIELEINVPSTWQSEARKYEIKIVAQSTRDRSLSAVTTGSWTILPFPAEPVLNVDPPRRRAPREAYYRVVVGNQSNATTSFQLSTIDEDDLLECRLEHEWLVIQPGARASVELRVRARQPLIGDRREFNFNVQAAPLGRNPQLVPAQFIQVAARPTWVIPLIVVGLCLLVAILVARQLPVTMPVPSFGPAQNLTAVAIYKTQAAALTTTAQTQAQQTANAADQARIIAATVISEVAMLRPTVIAQATLTATLLAPIQTAVVEQTKIAGTATQFALGVTQSALDSTAIANSVSTQVAQTRVAESIVQAALSAPRETLQAVATSQAQAVQNATAVGAAVAQAAVAQTVQAAAEKAAVAATKQAIANQPDHLEFGMQPSNTNATSVIRPEVTVLLMNSSGGVSFTSNVKVTLSLVPVAPTLPGAKLSGNVAVAINGVVTFSNLKIDRAGTYRLRASADKLRGKTSDQFTIN
jgi:pSer/pThr/pTyr-binding forkhead associated (FHA) protein